MRSSETRPAGERLPGGRLWPRLGVAALAVLAALVASACGGSSDRSPGSLTGTGVYDGVEVGFTDQGRPYMGDPQAPVTLEEFSDFLCPYCGRHAAETFPRLVREYVATGKVKYVFRDLPLASLHPTAVDGHVAARCVAEQGPELFWAIHEELFSTQDEWREESDPSTSLQAAAEKVGADADDYRSCVEAGEQQAWVEASVANATEKLGFDGTPSFRFVQSAGLARKANPEAKGPRTYQLVGAQPVATFAAWLDALGAGRTPPQEEQEDDKRAKLPYWANEKGLAPDPARPGFSKAGDPYKGDPDAMIAVVEFSNFQCPHCRAHSLDVQPTLDRKFVETGKIMWVFKNLPLQSLPQSTDAAVAAECAGDQGRFWEMHDALFERQKSWSVSSPGPVLRSIADEVGLDVDAFDACFASRDALQQVLQDMYDASGVVSTTPSFIVISGGRGGVLSGEKPAGEFATILQGFLDKAKPRG